MTEQRVTEIKEAAIDIMNAAADLQLAVKHGGYVPERQADMMFMNLQNIKNLAGTMLRVNGTRFDPEERKRLECLNALNALRAQLDQVNRPERLDEMSMYRLSAILENAQHRVKKYLLIKAEPVAVENAAEPAISIVSSNEAA